MNKLRKIGSSLVLFFGTLAYISYCKKTYFQKNKLEDKPGREKILDKSIINHQLPWLSEKNFEQAMDNKVLPFLVERMEEGTFDSHDFQLYYQYFQVEDAQATLVILHGFNEYKEKYREFIYYLLKKKIEVFVYDQRGHGYSRFNDHETQIDIHQFEDYAHDLDQFLHQIVNRKATTENFVMFGHSMGGAVVTKYLEEYSHSFSKAILNAPMLAIDTGKISLFESYYFAKSMTFLKLGKHYIPTTEKFDPEESGIFPDNSTVFKHTNRSKYFHFLNFALHEAPTKGGSIRWLLNAIQANNKMTRPQALEKIRIPCLIMRAENDLVVNPKGIYTAQHFIAQAISHVLPGAYHEMASEDDETIQIYYSDLLDFILNYQNEKIENTYLN